MKNSKVSLLLRNNHIYQRLKRPFSFRPLQVDTLLPDGISKHYYAAGTTPNFKEYRKQYQSTGSHVPSLNIGEFEMLEKADTGRHETYRSLHKPTSVYSYVKRVWPTINQVIEIQQTGQDIDRLYKGKSPEEVKFWGEKEVAATKLVRLFQGEDGLSPKSIFLVEEREGDWKYYYVASEEIPDYVGLDRLGKVVREENGKAKVEYFFVNEAGRTCLWLNNKHYVETFGRIRTKFALLTIGETDATNPQNIGICFNMESIRNLPVGCVGKAVPIVTIDHGGVIEKGGPFQFPDTHPKEYAKLMASGKVDSPIRVIDLKALPNILRREEVREASIQHIATCFREGWTINKIFLESFSKDYPEHYKLEKNKLIRDFYFHGTRFIAADILLRNQWDKTDGMAEEIWGRPENKKTLYGYLSRIPGIDSKLAPEENAYIQALKTSGTHAQKVDKSRLLASGQGASHCP